MKHVVLLATLIFLAACVESQPDSSAPVDVPAPAANVDVPKSQGIAVVGEHKFKVRYLAKKGYALVERPKTRGQYFAQDLEDAAQQVTGCDPTIFKGEWAILPDFRKFGLRELRPTMWNPHNAWRVDLEC